MLERFSSVRAQLVLPLLVVGAMTGGIEEMTVDPLSADDATPEAQLVERFVDPPAEYRPFYRYWHPGGRIDPDTLRAEFETMRDGGAGGVELANFVRDNEIAPIEDYEPGRHGFGSEAWTERVTDAYRTGAEAGLQVDVTYTSKYSANLPTMSPDEPGSAKELSLATARLEPGEEYAGQIPRADLPDGVEVADLVSLRAFPCSSGCDGDVPVLDPADSVDLESELTEAQGLRWTAPGGGRWVLIASWLHGTGQFVEGEETPGESYVIDHFSHTGLDAVQEYWNERVLDDELRARLAASGGSLFFDSLELNRDGNELRHWTKDFLREFEARRGYDVQAYIPALAVQEPAFEFPGALGERIREDYRQTLHELFRDEHLIPLRDWAHELGLTLRGQPYSSWGPSFADPIEAWSLLDVPEGEDRSFNAGAGQDFIETQGADAFRSMATAAQLSGNEVVSTECCASFGRAHRVTRQELLSHVHQNFSVGVNRVVWHGWSHDAPGTAGNWPGWAGFGNTGVDDSYGPRNPTWADDKAINDYVARLQVALRAGQARTDVAIYHQEPGHSSEGTVGERYFADAGLEQRGYTYGFVNSTLLAAADLRGYGAFVVDQEEAMAPEVARRIVDLARDGLSVVVVGEAPSRAVGNRPSEDAAVGAAFAELREIDGVRRVESADEVVPALEGMGVTPRAAFDDATSLVGVQRSIGDADVFYWYNASEQRETATVSVAADGIPYRLDPWTGAVEPLAAYSSDGGRTRLEVDVAPGDAVLVAVSDVPLGDEDVPDAHVVRTTADDTTLVDGRPQLRVTTKGVHTAVLSDGRRVASYVRHVPPARVLPDWDLAVASWHEGAHPQETIIIDLPERAVTSSEGSGRLPAWDELAGLETVSGVGTYRTTFELGERWPEGAGAYLDLGDVVTTYRVEVNGRPVGPVDQLDSLVDIGPLLRPGTNEVVVTVSTMLGNAVAGEAVNSYGMIGPVRLVPYVDEPIVDARGDRQ